MFIKAWNNHDGGVYQINKAAIGAAYKQRLEKIFTKEQISELKQIAREFQEELGLVFVHNLKKGWEQRILEGGKVFASYEKKELKSAAEIKAVISEKGQIEFIAHKELSSWKFIQKFLKPAKERWPE
jgi:hypothetical protein